MMGRSDKKADNLINAVYQRLMHTRADEIARLKEERLARQLREKEEGIRKLSMRRKAIQSRFERFISACMQDSLQRATRN